MNSWDKLEQQKEIVFEYTIGLKPILLDDQQHLSNTNRRIQESQKAIKANNGEYNYRLEHDLIFNRLALLGYTSQNNILRREQEVELFRCNKEMFFAASESLIQYQQKQITEYTRMVPLKDDSYLQQEENFYKMLEKEQSAHGGDPRYLMIEDWIEFEKIIYLNRPTKMAATATLCVQNIQELNKLMLQDADEGEMFDNPYKTLQTKNNLWPSDLSNN